METRDDWRRRGLRVPGGYEVESAVFHPGMIVVEPLPAESRIGVRKKIDDLKSRSLQKVHHVQHALQHRTGSMKRSVSRRRTVARNAIVQQRTRMQRSMEMSPMKWAGIAAVSGVAIGMLGRLAQWRSHRPHVHHELVIIEANC